MSSPVSTDLSDKKPGLATAALALLVFLSAGAIVLIFLALGRGEAKYDAERATKRIENLAKLRETNAKIVNEYAVLDKEKGIYQIPLSQAVALTALELAKIEPKAAYPVATPIPPAAPAADETAAPAADGTAAPAADGTAAPADPSVAPTPATDPATPAATP